MKIFQRLERKLEGAVDGGFARVFGGRVAPQEIEYSLQRQAEASVEDLGDGSMLADNSYVVRLSPSDLERVAAEYELNRKTFSRHLENFIADNGWQTYGPVIVEFEEQDNLHTGQFRAQSTINPDLRPRPVTTAAPSPQQSRQPAPPNAGASDMSQHPGPDPRWGGDPAQQQGYDQQGYDQQQGGYAHGQASDPQAYDPNQGYGQQSGPQAGAYSGGQAAPEPQAYDPNQGYPNQGYQDQGYQQQGYQQPAYDAGQYDPNQGYGQQAPYDPSQYDPNQAYDLNQGYQDQGYQQQGYQDPGQAAPGYQDQYQQGYPDHGYQDQGHQQAPAYDQGYGQQPPAYDQQGYQQGYDQQQPPAYDPQQGYAQPGYEQQAPGYEQPGYQQPGYDYGQPAAAPGYAAAPAQVTLMLQDGSDRSFVLRHGSNVVGRGHDAQFRLPDTGVSRSHVDIKWDGQIAMLTDLNSTNGTTVNDMQVSTWELNNGDRIRLGHSEITVHIQ